MDHEDISCIASFTGDPYELPTVDGGRGEVRGECMAGLGGLPTTDAGRLGVCQHPDSAHDPVTGGLLCGKFIKL